MEENISAIKEKIVNFQSEIENIKKNCRLDWIMPPSPQVCWSPNHWCLCLLITGASSFGNRAFVDVLSLSCQTNFDSLQLHGLQHTRLPCPSLSPGTCSNSCPFVDGASKNEVLLEESELYIQSLDFYVKIDSDTEETGGRMPCKGGVGDWSFAATSKGMLVIARSEEKSPSKSL